MLRVDDRPHDAATADRSARGLLHVRWHEDFWSAIVTIESVTNADAMPVLERLIQFTGQRHRMVVHNIANLNTPDFTPKDVSVDAFQTQLGEAIDARRDRTGNHGGDLPMESTEQVVVRPDGLELRPTTPSGNILFHDRNDRDPERMMQALVENFMSFRAAVDLWRGRMDLIDIAIKERL
jgi:flagellar basal-body rod protein FlgB